MTTTTPGPARPRRSLVGAAEWDHLEQAALSHDALCAGDGRFTDDDTNPADLAPVCARCPLFAECVDYATAARPPGGVWAGRRYDGTQRKGKSA